MALVFVLFFVFVLFSQRATHAPVDVSALHQLLSAVVARAIVLVARQINQVQRACM